MADEAASGEAVKVASKPPEPAKEGTRKEAERAESALKEWVGLLLRAAFWALLIYQFVFQVSVVVGHSMEPNFFDGDRLLIDKVVFKFREPRAGEAVVFEAVVQDQITNKRVPRDFIKRVIAGPNDEVKLYDGKVHVNGVEMPEPWGPQAFGGEPSWKTEGNALVYVLPPDRYFVLGDNRSSGGSEDSREGKIGYVHRRQIKGKVRWRFYPFDRARWY